MIDDVVTFEETSVMLSPLFSCLPSKFWGGLATQEGSATRPNLTGNGAVFGGVFVQRSLAFECDRRSAGGVMHVRRLLKFEKTL